MNIKDEPVECTVLGKVLGTMTGFDFVDDMCLCFYDFVPGELGKKFLRAQKVEESDSLTVNFENAAVQLDHYQETPESEYKFTIVNPDWSVFNKELTDEQEKAFNQSLSIDGGGTGG